MNDTTLTSNALDNMPDLDIDIDATDNSVIEEPIHIEGIDPRLQLLSHSSRGTLNKCARKYQLYRLSSTKCDNEDDLADSYQQATFDYGTIVGIGIQSILQGKSVDSILIECLLEWKEDFLLRNNKQAKSFWEAVFAIQQFQRIVDDGYLEDYELVEYQGKPAVELSFRITLPNGFKYRGYIDGVLRHKLTGAIVVLEDKTTSYRNVNPAQYKNSGQALGYSIILDHIFPKLSSYTVLYLVYSTPLKEFVELPFEKSSLQRALWLTELLMDTKKVEMYEAFGVYPMNGDFCYDFYRECEYLGLCTMSTDKLTKPLTQKILDDIADREVYDFDLNFVDLIETQVEKND